GDFSVSIGCARVILPASTAMVTAGMMVPTMTGHIPTRPIIARRENDRPSAVNRSAHAGRPPNSRDMPVIPESTPCAVSMPAMHLLDEGIRGRLHNVRLHCRDRLCAGQ